MKFNIILAFFLFCSIPSIAQYSRAQDYINDANQYLKKEEYVKALEVLTTGIRTIRDSSNLYEMRGAILESFRMYNEAIQDFTMGIEKAETPEIKSRMLSNRGGTKFRIMDFQGGYEDLTEAVKIDSTNLSALNNLAAVCPKVDRPEESLKYLQQIIQIDPKFVPAYVNLGFRYQNMGEYEKSIQYFDKAIQLDPNEALGYSNRSFSKLKIKDLKGALKDINQSIKLMPMNSYAFKIRALISIEKNNKEEACKDLAKAEELGYADQFGEEVKELQTKYCK